MAMEIRTAINRYCNYQERCHEEVKTKLIELGADLEYANALIAELITSNLLNEERFAQSYARGKFSQKKWGRNKIRQNLKSKKVSAYCIKKGLAEIDEEDYEKTLLQLGEKTLEKYGQDPMWIQRAKTCRYLIGKGFENDLIQDTLNKLLNTP